MRCGGTWGELVSSALHDGLSAPGHTSLAPGPRPGSGLPTVSQSCFLKAGAVTFALPSSQPCSNLCTKPKNLYAAGTKQLPIKALADCGTGSSVTAPQAPPGPEGGKARSRCTGEFLNDCKHRAREQAQRWHSGMEEPLVGMAAVTQFVESRGAPRHNWPSSSNPAINFQALTSKHWGGNPAVALSGCVRHVITAPTLDVHQELG